MPKRVHGVDTAIINVSFRTNYAVRAALRARAHKLDCDMSDVLREIVAEAIARWDGERGERKKGGKRPAVKPDSPSAA